jgi:hypothetical protein
MHGDRQVSEKRLARIIGVKTIVPCTPDIAHKHTGYLVGIDPQEAVRLLKPVLVTVGMDKE